MANDQELSLEAVKAVETAEKLMRLAGKNPNQNEASAATAKAMALLAAHNLDVSIIEQGGGEKSKRTDEKMKGGLYKYQRDLWQAVAELNFCMYWNQYVFDPTKISQYWLRQGYSREELVAMGKGGYRFQHRVVGRVVNVVATRNMTDYLEGTIDRLTRERLMDVNSRNQGDRIEQLWGAWAVQFRSGVADEVVGKLYERRRELLQADKIKAHEATEAAARAAKAGVSTATALTVSSLAKSESDANADFLHGEGYSARVAAKRAEQAKAWADAEEERVKWAAAHPEEAAKEAEDERKRQKRVPWNYGMSSKSDRQYTGAYYSGREAGKSVSIDQQVGDAATQRKIGGRK